MSFFDFSLLKGLFLGASLLSYIEIVELLVSLFFVVVCHPIRKYKVGQK